MKALSRPKMSLKKWYGSSVRIPNINTYQFRSFVVSGMGIVRTLVRKEYQKPITIRFQMGGTASANIENDIISINERFLHGEFSPTIRIDDSDEVLTVILGVVVHEVAHFAYSAPTLEHFADHVKEFSDAPFNQKIAMYMGNIVEDIFIEAEVDREVPSLTWMIEAANEVLFNDEYEAKVIGNSEFITEPPTEPMAVLAILDTLLMAKTRSYIEVNPFLFELFQLTRTAESKGTLAERRSLVLELYNRIMQNVELPECDSPEGAALDQETGAHIARSNGLMADHQEGTPEPITWGIGAIATDITSSLRDTEESTVLLMSSIDEMSESTLVVETPISMHTEGVEVDKRYEELAQVARQRSVINRPYGQDMVRGSKIRKLYRIGTDGKIFAEQVTARNYAPAEVIIGVDCSGSMCALMSGGNNRITRAWQSAAGAAFSLVEGRCDVAVYGHTADITDQFSLDIYCAKGFGDSINCLPYTAKEIIENQETKENRDGLAIRYIGSKFRTLTKRRIFIMFSDGQPAASRYGGSMAIEHSRKEVDGLRSRGITVLSISLTREAKVANDQIYGPDYNIYNEDPDIIEQIISSIMLV